MQQVYGWRAVAAAVQQLEKDGYFVYEVLESLYLLFVQLANIDF